MTKRASLLLIITLAVLSLLMIESAVAQSIPKPSVPTFTLKLVDNSYDVPPIPPTPPTYTTDPYSGKQTILNPGSPGLPGYHVDNRTIELWIKNQQYTFSNGSATFHLYYDVQIKGHFGENWTELYPTVYLRTMRINITFNGAPSQYLSFSSPIQSNSEFTVLSRNGNYREGDQVDFQVKAVIGHDSQYYAGDNYGGNFIYHDYFLPAVAFDTDSDWSNTQTITYPDGSTSTPTSPNPTPSPSPTPTPEPIPSPEPQQSEPLLTSSVISVLEALAIIAGAGLLVAGLLVYFKKRKR